MVANSVMAALMIGIIVFSVLVVAVRYALKFFRVSNYFAQSYRTINGSAGCALESDERFLQEW